MDTANSLEQARKALKLINEIEENDRREGLNLIENVLESNSPTLVDYGYDKLIMKELLKTAKFESSSNLGAIFSILQKHYARDDSNQDEIMETLLYVYGLSCRFEIAMVCVDQMLFLVDQMRDNIAKHSKQIMQAAEMNTFISLNEKFVEILEKLKKKLPLRKALV